MVGLLRSKILLCGYLERYQKIDNRKSIGDYKMKAKIKITIILAILILSQLACGRWYEGINSTNAESRTILIAAITDCGKDGGNWDNNLGCQFK
jgi:hypothetical protein